MPFSKAVSSFDPETLELLRQAFDSAWQEAQASGQPDNVLVRELMAARIMIAARNGERDPEALKAAALGPR